MSKIKLILIFVLGIMFGNLISYFYNTYTTETDNSFVNSPEVEKEKPLDNTCPNDYLQKQTYPSRHPTESIVENGVNKDALTFLSQIEPIDSNNYVDFINQQSSEVMAHYENLNQDLYNAFEFENKEQLEAALANGFPSPAELDYVYSRDVDDLVEDMISRGEAVKSLKNPEYAKVEKMATLTFNRVMDEFVDVLRLYRPSYQEGDDLPEFQGANRSSLPTDLKDAMENVIRLKSLANGNLAFSYLTSARFNELNVFSYDTEFLKFERYAELAVAEVKLKTRNVRTSIWPNRKDVPPEFVAIQAALLNIDLPTKNKPYAS